MTKTITFLIAAIFTTLQLSAQTSDSLAFMQLQQQVGKLKTDLKNQKTDFSKKLSSASAEIKTLQNNVEALRAISAQIADSLGIKISETATNADNKIAGMSENISRKTLFGIFSGIVLLLLSVGLFLYLYLKRKSDSANIIKQLEEQKSSIETKLVKEYSRQAEVLENLMKTIRELPISVADSSEPDHSLALKLADEIVLMERNISHMNQDTKGLKPLIRAIERLKANLNSNGYELVELIGKAYSEGMKVTIVSSVPDENASKGEDIITKIIKPQVNYQDKMIQMAQVEITVGVN